MKPKMFENGKRTGLFYRGYNENEKYQAAIEAHDTDWLNLRIRLAMERVSQLVTNGTATDQKLLERCLKKLEESILRCCHSQDGSQSEKILEMSQMYLVKEMYMYRVLCTFIQ